MTGEAGIKGGAVRTAGVGSPRRGGLVPAELLRLVSRRLVWGLFAAAVLLGGTVIYSTFNEFEGFSVQDTALIRQEVARQHAEWAANHEEREIACRAELLPSERATDTMCLEPEPTVEGQIGRTDTPAVFDSATGGAVQSSMLVAFTLGASLIGAEFTTGSILGWLTFAPRRGRVLAAKVLAAALGGLVVGALAVLTVAAGALWVSAHNGYLAQSSSGEVLGAVGAMCRVLPAAAGFAAVGGALGALLRGTAAVFGTAVGYLFLEFIVRSNWPAVTPYTLSANLGALISGGSSWSDLNCSGGSCESVEQSITLTHGSIYLAIVAALVLLVAFWRFGRRDFT